MNAKRQCVAVLLLLLTITAVSTPAADYLVSYPRLVEVYGWTRGCTPTATAMVLSYWDHYADGIGKYTYWGRLIDYYQNRNTCDNISNLLDQLANAMNTTSNGMTRYDAISSGITSVTNSTNGYDFSSQRRGYSYCGGDCRNAIKNEINNNRPFVYSLSGQSSGHSTAAWGYTSNSEVILYDTWDHCPRLPHTQYREDWPINRYYNGRYWEAATYTQINTAVPGGGSGGNDLVLDDPYGGERLVAGSDYQIQWYQWGSAIGRVTIEYSTDGGHSWRTVISLLPSAGEGWHSYTWKVPCITTSRARIRIYGYFCFVVCFTRAGDGSYDDFSIVSPSFSAPSGPSASKSSPCVGVTYTINWGSVGGATAYELYENGNKVYDGGARSKSFTKNSPGSYSYRVRAKNDCAVGSYSGTRSVNVTSPPASAPGNPVVSTDTAYTGQSFVINWQAVTGADTYEIWSRGSWTDVGDVTSWIHVEEDTGLFHYRIRGRNGCGVGAETAPISVCVLKGADIDAVREIAVSPNPYVPSRGHAEIIFFGKRLPHAEIDVYDKSARHVATITADGDSPYLNWTPIDDNGEPLASGVYIWVAKDSRGDPMKGKFAVIR